MLTAKLPVTLLLLLLLALKSAWLADRALHATASAVLTFRAVAQRRLLGCRLLMMLCQQRPIVWRPPARGQMHGNVRTFVPFAFACLMPLTCLPDNQLSAWLLPKLVLL